MTERLIKAGTVYGISLTEVEAQEGLDLLKTDGKELSEDELSSVSGGAGIRK
ncbi:MAG TPA: bacteriocin [Thermotogota bacterium]|nr:bacteriocin [Thermotogota bacterium]